MLCRVVLSDLHAKQPNSRLKVVPIDNPAADKITITYPNTSPGIKRLLEQDLLELEHDAFYLRVVQRDPMGVHGVWRDVVLRVEPASVARHGKHLAYRACLETEVEIEREGAQQPKDWASMLDLR